MKLHMPIPMDAIGVDTYMAPLLRAAAEGDLTKIGDVERHKEAETTSLTILFRLKPFEQFGDIRTHHLQDSRPPRSGRLRHVTILLFEKLQSWRSDGIVDVIDDDINITLAISVS